MMSASSIELLPPSQEQVLRQVPLGAGAVIGCLGNQVSSALLGRLLVKVRLSGPIAAVEVMQSFQVTAPEPIDCYYLFPLSSSGSISRFRVQVGSKVSEMQVVPRDQVANLQRYEVPGFLAGLFEGEYESVFCAPLGRLSPGETVNVDLAYAELVQTIAGDCRFHFPLLTASRFQTGASIDQIEDGAVTLTPGITAGPNFAISVALEVAGSAPTRLSCSHPLASHQLPTGELGLELARQDVPTRDFTLAYRFGQEKNPNGLLRMGQRHFCYHLHSPQMAPPTTLPRHLILLLDISENCQGPRLEVTKRVAAELLQSLGPGENFSLVGFNHQLTGYETGIACGREHVPQAIEWLERLRPGGRADMSIILERILQLPPEPGRGMLVQLLVCGRVGNEPELYSTLTNYPPNIRFNCLGIDRAVNTSFLRRLSGYTRGHAVFVGNDGPDPLTLQKLVHDSRAPLVGEVQLVDQGLGINPETFSPRSILGLGLNDTVTVLGLKAGNGALEVRGRSFSGHPWAEAVSPLPSQNPAFGVVWAHFKAREMSEELKLISGPTASRLRDVSASLARDYRLVGDFTASLLGDASGALWLPPLYPPEWRPEQVVDLTKTKSSRLSPPPPVEDLPPRPASPAMQEPPEVRPEPVEPAGDSGGSSGLTRKAVIHGKSKHENKQNKLSPGRKSQSVVKPILGEKPSIGGKPVLHHNKNRTTTKTEVSDERDNRPRLGGTITKTDAKPETKVETQPESTVTTVGKEPEPTPPPPPPVAPPAVAPSAEETPESIAKGVFARNPELRQTSMADLKLIYQHLTKAAQDGTGLDPQLLPVLERTLRRLQPVLEESTLIKEAYRVGVLCYQAQRGQDPQAVVKTQHWVQRFAKLF